MNRVNQLLAGGLATVLSVAVILHAGPAAAQSFCPAGLRVVRSSGDTVDYLGHVPGIPDLCRHERSRDGAGDFYMGIWRSDWPGAGLAYPVVRRVMLGSQGLRESFVTRSFPGLQWTDSYTNEGIATVVVGNVAHRALRLAHEREGIEGNTYHSIITHWLDTRSWVMLRTYENQISGQSYGPQTTWVATRIEELR